ncbi:MAG: hypothetical protein CMH25_05435 [Micavibrio sp.]|nr:hypothetical protein [Micavibrio sp.]
MKSVERHLYRHSNGTYYYRYTFPELHNHKSFEVITSLKTKDAYQAKSISLGLRIITNRILEGLSSSVMRVKLKSVSDNQFKMIVRDYIKESLKRIKMQIESGNSYYTYIESQGYESPDLKDINWIDSKSYLLPEGFVYEANDIEKLRNERNAESDIRFPQLSEIKDFNTANNTDLQNPTTSDVIEWLYLKHDISEYVAQGATPYKKLIRHLGAVYPYLEHVRYCEKTGEADNVASFEEWCEKQRAHFAEYRRNQNSSSVTQRNTVDSPKLSELIEPYVTEGKAQKLAHTTIKDRESNILFLIEILGDVQINELCGDKARKVKDVLLSFPSNRKKRYPDLELSEILEKDIPESEIISVRTINKYIQNFSTFINWAKNNNYYKGDNPFSRLSIKSPSKSQRDERQPFTNDDLIKIFSSPIYQGSAGPKNNQRYAKGNYIDNKSADFWVPLIALYSGLRRSEICGLYLKDIRKSEGDIWVFDINDEGTGKKAKTHSTIRELPIHKRLIELGLLEVAEELKEKGRERLFPQLELDKQGSYGDAYGKRFAYLTKNKLGITGGNKAFHSFRHNVTDAIRRLEGCPSDIAHYITGHSFNESVQSRYGSKPDLKRVKSWVDKIECPVLDSILDRIKERNDG